MSKTRWAVVLLLVAAAFSSAAAQTWREKLDAALAVRESYDFKDMALGDMLRVVSQDAEINIVTDSAEGGVDLTRKMTLALKDMSYANILTWITRLSGLEWCVQDEAIYITRPDRLDEVAKVQIEQRNKAKRVTAEKTWLPAFRKALAAPISPQFLRKPLSECAKSLEALIGVNVILAGDVGARSVIDLAVSNMTAENVLAWIARKAKIDYAVLDAAVYFGSPERIERIRTAGLDFSVRGRAYDMVSFDFENVPLDQAIRELAKQTGVEIILRCQMPKLPAVTAAGTDMTLTAALKAITGLTGLNSMILAEGGTVIVSIMEPAPTPPPAVYEGDAEETPAPVEE